MICIKAAQLYLEPPLNMTDTTLICLDLEGVLIPEIWHGVAERTGIAELGLTTRDIKDYNVLMTHRLQLLNQHNLTLSHIQQVIATMEPLPGAQEFLNTLRQQFQVVILSDTFYEFAQPLMEKLHWPTLLCHRLTIDNQDRISGYQLRQPDQKRVAVESFQRMALRVFAAGDSYNDLTMLRAADKAVLFRPPEQICQENPDLTVVQGYEELLTVFK